MKLKVQIWGSLALRIPKALAIEANVASGSTVEISLSDGELRIKPVEDQDYSLDELLSESQLRIFMMKFQWVFHRGKNPGDEHEVLS